MEQRVQNVNDSGSSQEKEAVIDSNEKWDLEKGIMAKLVGIWGSLITLGENATKFLNCERTTLMVAISKWPRINEEVEVEVGKEIFRVYIAELTASTSRTEEQISGEVGKVSVAAETETEASSSSGGTVESDWRSQKQGGKLQRNKDAE
ncbi:hypothetical protein V6N13_017291 [Hibiscus sabdariffa]